MKFYETPLYDLKIDTAMISELNSTGKFQFMDKKTDEDEHSIESILIYNFLIEFISLAIFLFLPLLQCIYHTSQK